MPLESARFAIIDVETTGLEHEDRVIEVACVVTEGRVERERFETLVKADREIPPEVIAIHGIREADLRSSPRFSAILPRVESLVTGSVLVAHNAQYDVSFLRREFSAAGKVFPKLRVCDTLFLARNLHVLEHYALDALSEHFGLENRPAHRAMQDVETTRELLWKLIDLTEPRPRTLGELLDLLIPPPVTWEEAERDGAIEPPLVDLRHGVEDGASLRISYVGRSGEETVHSIGPGTLERSAGHIYLRAPLIGESDLRIFRLDRIGAIQVLEEE